MLERAAEALTRVEAAEALVNLLQRPYLHAGSCSALGTRRKRLALLIEQAERLVAW